MSMLELPEIDCGAPVAERCERWETVARRLYRVLRDARDDERGATKAALFEARIMAESHSPPVGLNQVHRGALHDFTRQELAEAFEWLRVMSLTESRAPYHATAALFDWAEQCRLVTELRKGPRPLGGSALAQWQAWHSRDSSAEPNPLAEAKSWRCFHCDDTFRTEADARNHFGSTEGSDPACLIKGSGEFALLLALRNSEDQLARYRADDSDVLRAMWSTRADHSAALRREEEAGYARGLRDAKAHPETIGLQRAAPETATDAPSA